MDKYTLYFGNMIKTDDGEWVKLEDAKRSLQWSAFDKVLQWINEQDKKMVSKGDLYDAVMEMRPEYD